MHTSTLFGSLPLLALTLAAGAVPALAQQIHTTREPVQLSYETYTLDNGLNVILSRDTTLPVASVNLWYHVGSGNEEVGRTGFAHLFEHMMFQGSENVGDDQHFKLIQAAGWHAERLDQLRPHQLLRVDSPRTTSSGSFGSKRIGWAFCSQP